MVDKQPLDNSHSWTVCKGTKKQLNKYVEPLARRRHFYVRAYAYAYTAAKCETFKRKTILIWIQLTTGKYFFINDKWYGIFYDGKRERGRGNLLGQQSLRVLTAEWLHSFVTFHLRYEHVGTNYVNPTSDECRLYYLRCMCWEHRFASLSFRNISFFRKP